MLEHASITSKAMFSPSLSQSSLNMESYSSILSTCHRTSMSHPLASPAKYEFIRIFGFASFFSMGQTKSSEGSTLSQLLYFEGKSTVMTWPQVEVNLKCAVWPMNFPWYSATEQTPLLPFLVVYWLFERILAIESARIGFSATIRTLSTPILNGQQ